MAVQDAPNPIVHRIKMNPGNETRKAKTKLDEILEEKEVMAARRYSAAELEKMALQAESEVAKLRGEPPPYGGKTMNNEETKKKDEEQREKLLNSAKALIDSGMEPKQVGQMLLGLTPTSATATYPPVQGMTYDDVVKLINLIMGKRETDEIKATVAALDRKVDELIKSREGKPKEESRIPTPMEYAKQHAEYIEALEKLGIMKKPEVITPEGKSLDILREENRHAEKMEEIRADREYKQGLVEIATDIPERVGRGLAAQFTASEGGEGSSGKSSKLEYLVCEEENCGISIPIPKGATTATCPKCGAIYSRGEETGQPPTAKASGLVPGAFPKREVRDDRAVDNAL